MHIATEKLVDIRTLNTLVYFDKHDILLFKK